MRCQREGEPDSPRSLSSRVGVSVCIQQPVAILHRSCFRELRYKLAQMHPFEAHRIPRLGGSFGKPFGTNARHRGH